jgi:hypothetical protein
MHGLNVDNVAYSGCYTRLVCLAPAAAEAWAAPKSQQLANSTLPQSPLPYLPLPPLTQSPNQQTNQYCFFCGGPHPIHTCLTAVNYLQAG